MPQQAPDVELANAGPGPDPLSLSELAARDDVDAIVLLFQRDHYCIHSRHQVQQVNGRYAEFTTRNAWIVSVVPEDRRRARSWVERYDVMFPIVADPDHAAGEAYGQPTRYGKLGEVSDLLGRLPLAVVLDTREGELSIAHTHAGQTAGDRPSVDELLAKITEITGNEGVDPDNFR